MWMVNGFRTLDEAKAFQKTHGGYVCWEQRTPKRKKLTELGKEYVIAAGAVGLDTEEYKYIVERRI